MYLLCHLSHARSHFSRASFETVIYAFVTFHLYCNSLVARLPAFTLYPLQPIQDYTSRLL